MKAPRPRAVVLLTAALLLGLGTRQSWGDGPSLRAELEELEADSVLSEAARDPLAQARQAFDNAARLRAQQPAQAQLATSVVQEWLNVVKDLKRAIAAEQRATAHEHQAERLRRQLETERLLLEESAVDKQRLEGVVQQLETDESERLGTTAPERREAP